MSRSYKLSELSELYRESVQAELKEVINGSPVHLRGILLYHMGWQDEKGAPSREKTGKFLRSILCLLSCRAVGGEPGRILPVAATLELIHNFSLIHDDIQDASPERHGRPTVWKLWGQSQAINAGDVMFALAILASLRLRKNGISDEAVLHVFRLLSETCLELCEGQYLDIEYENKIGATVEDYLGMIRKKTAALIAACTSLGAYLGGGGAKVTHLSEFGEKLGMAYQIHDDILGIWGSQKETGKSVRGDIQQRKKTLPVLYGLWNSQGGDRLKLERLYSGGNIDDSDVSTVMSILTEVGAKDYARKLAQEYYEQALRHLEASELDDVSQSPLKEIVYFLKDRNY
ncbi:MAG: polyprenyl synthetase family protein [Dehalococcoidia bacterium]|nr:polyprenyl synthetase family protein [Dehalococcoidia bacterium]